MCDGPSPTCHPPEREECETSVEHVLALWAEPAVGYCSRRPRPSPMWRSRFVEARAVWPWVGEQKPLGNTPLGGDDLPTYLHFARQYIALSRPWLVLQMESSVFRDLCSHLPRMWGR